MQMAHLLAVLSFALSGSTGSRQLEQVPLFDRVLVFSLPADMTIANQKDNGTNILIEYVPRGETLSDWTRLVTIQSYRGLGRSPMTSAEIARQAFYPAVCQLGPIYQYSGERILANGDKRSVIANGCASLPAGAYPKAMKGAGEQDFILMFRDAETIYTLNYAIRGPSFAGRKPPIAIEQGETTLYRIFGKVRLTANSQ